jgi:hypothetical protein
VGPQHAAFLLWHLAATAVIKTAANSIEVDQPKGQMQQCKLGHSIPPSSSGTCLAAAAAAAAATLARMIKPHLQGLQN